MSPMKNNIAAWSRRLLLPAVMAVFIGNVAPAGASAGKGATAVIEKAIRQRSAGDLGGAIANLRTAVETSETSGQRSLASFMLGDCLMESGKPAEATGIFQSILSDDPSEEERAEALFRLAQCSKATGDVAGLKKYCRQITSQYPDSPFAELARLLSRSAAAEKAASEALAAVSTTTETPATESETAATAPAQQVPETAQARVKSTRPVPTYEGIDQETSDAMQSQPAPKAEPKPEPKQEPKPEPKSEPETGAARPDVSDTTKAPEPSAPQVAKPAVKRITKTPQKTAPSADIADLITLAPLSGEEREALATQILQDQELVKANPKFDDADDILFRIAEATARFGEPLEACKIYDRILTEFQQSKHIERAYFEGIRLRALLGLRPVVSQWGQAFLQSFPKSSRSNDIRRLIAWAEQAASARPRAKKATDRAERKTSATAPSGTYTPESDPRYRQAKRRVADNRFALAMNDFQVLTDAHPDVPELWWDLVLVQIQLQRYDDAEESLNRLLALQPENQDARSLLGYVHYHQKDFNQAADDYRQAGASESDGLKFFDSQTAARRMERSSKTSQPSSTREGGNE